MLNVYITVDVEIWCDGWKDIDRKFPKAFDSYIYGRTPHGDCGLPLKLKILEEYGIKATFFVEPLFATRFGLAPLQEIIGLIREYNQDVQLHLHTEWVDEASTPLLPNSTTKRQHMKHYSLDEQCKLVNIGVDLLKQCGCLNTNAFRAGSFGANMDTIEALRRNNILIDSSYNYTFLDRVCEIQHTEPLRQATLINGVYEYPLSYFHDSKNSSRHAQLGACSSRELIHCMKLAKQREWDSFVLLSHNFELLNGKKSGPDKTVIARFHRICKFLDKHRSDFPSCTFGELTPPIQVGSQPLSIESRWLDSRARTIEQIIRRFH